MPYTKLTQWLAEEKQAGAPNPQHAVLATSHHNIPHSRIVAIREISSQGFIFFTQATTRKVMEINQNPVVSLNFWFELMQRQVIIEGGIQALTAEENNSFWQANSKEAQIRFYAYAPTSSQPIASKQLLEDKRQQLSQQYSQQSLPLHPSYCGFLIKPTQFYFYTYRLDELSDVCTYVCDAEGGWLMQLLSP